jgi:hypothetical protein
LPINAAWHWKGQVSRIADDKNDWDNSISAYGLDSGNTRSACQPIISGD